MIGRDASRTLRRLGGRVARLTGRAAQYDWQAWYRQAVKSRPVETVLARHPDAHLLDAGFNVGTYLERNQDISDAVASPGEAVYHYLEFGHAEGRVARPDRWNASFVRQHHGIEVGATLSAPDANAALRRAGIPVHRALLHEPHLWQVNGICGPIFEGMFEHEVYAVLAEAAGMPVGATDRLSAIRHFCETGLTRGVPPHPDHRFDAAFYRAALALDGVAPPADGTQAGLLRHWAAIGVRAGAHANPQAWFRMKTGVRLPDAVLAALPAFAAASADLPDDASLPQTLSHLAQVPMPGATALACDADDVAGFLVDLARSRRQAGDLRAAEWLLSHVVAQRPGDARAGLDLADLLSEGRYGGAEIQLRRAVPSGFDGGANEIALAERLVADTRLDAALTVCAALPDSVFGDVGLRRRRRDLGRRIFEDLWDNLSTHLKTTPVSILQDKLARALALYTPPFEAPPRSAPIRRVAILANDGLYQCKLYRADQKADQLRAAGYIADVHSHEVDLDALQARLAEYDAIIVMRVPAFPPVIDLIAEAAQLGLATFYDCDDLIFDAAIFPPALSTYAGSITQTDHDAIACGVPLFRHAMSLCSYGIASTPTIRAEMEKVVRTGQVFVHRNALGRAHMNAIAAGPVAAAQGDRKLVIFYGSGTRAHKAEFHDILEPALAEVLKARPGKVEIRIIGEFSGLTHLDPEHPDVTRVDPIWDFEAYCAEVARADINLSILSPSRLTDAKSEIKWMEAAMFAIPSVVSPTATHRDVIEDGVNGFLCADRAAYVTVLLRLVDDPALRRRVGEAARRTVMAEYGLPAMGANFDAIFDTVRPADVRKQRLLIVNVFYPPQDIGGATRVVQDNVTDLVTRYGDRYEIDVVATLEGGETPYRTKVHGRDGARVWTVTAREGIETMDVHDHRMATVFDQLLGRIAPDLVHFHCVQRLTASSVDAVRRRDIPYLVTLHDGWWISPNQFITSPTGVRETYDFNAPPLPERAQITRRCLDGAEVVLAVSPAFAELHRQCGVNQARCVENGVSTLPELVRQPGRAGRVRLGHIGGASRHKGYALLRAAVESRRFGNLDLVVLDHALAPGRTRTEIWNGTPVTFLPRLSLDRVGEIYGQIDVLLAPSTWPESYGLVTREAVSLGLWVVASDRGAVGQQVSEGENGHIVDVSDHRGLTDCLARIDADPARYARPPATRPKLRPASAQAEELHEIYQGILGGGASEDEI